MERVIKQGAQGSGGVVIPGSGYGTWGHVLVVTIVLVLGWLLDLVTLYVFSNLNNSTIHRNAILLKKNVWGTNGWLYVYQSQPNAQEAHTQYLPEKEGKEKR